MKCLLGFLVIIALATSFGAHSDAAPAPTLFAYNNVTKQCGAFRDGDEYVRYDLPKDWQTYDYQKSTAKSTQEYCDELGYTNVGSVVAYLNLQPINVRQKDTINSINPHKTNYPLVIILLIGFGVATVAITLLVKKIKSDQPLKNKID